MEDALKAFRLIAAEFKNLDDTTVLGYLELYAPFVSKKQFGNVYGTALAYYTAHKMKLRGLSGSEDESMKNAALNIGVASYSEGDTSISYSSPASSGSTETDAELTLTVYGIEFMRMIRSCVICGVI